MSKTKVTTNSHIEKLGPGVVTTRREVGPTCPLDCPLLPLRMRRPGVDLPYGHDGLCYAGRGLMRMSEHYVGESDDDLSKADSVALIRHLVGGGWMKATSDGRRVVDRRFCQSVIDWHNERRQRFTIGWGYTHAPERLQKAGYGPRSWPKGLKLLASCHDQDHARELQRSGWNTARVIDSPSDKAKGETLCPWDLAKHSKKEPAVNCASCRLCFPGSKHNIAFVKLK